MSTALIFSILLFRAALSSVPRLIQTPLSWEWGDWIKTKRTGRCVCAAIRSGSCRSCKYIHLTIKAPVSIKLEGDSILVASDRLSRLNETPNNPECLSGIRNITLRKYYHGNSII